jgi:hypothetical protein
MKVTKTGIELIAAERNEQIVKHGRTVIKDVAYNSNRVPPFNLLPLRLGAGKMLGVLGGVPYPENWDKEICEKMDAKTDLQKLIIAGAFIAAEIDRMNLIIEEMEDAEKMEK